MSILRESGAQSVLDMGCGDGALVSVLLNSAAFTKLAGVDINPARVKYASELCKPNENDFLYLRERPVTLQLFHGSILHPDERLKGYDALACVEVIEHLPPECVDLMAQVFLGFYSPKIVVISTPNAEFNVHFPNLNYMKEGSKFRDDDHKFEWTRQEFEEWAIWNAGKYGYTVSFAGVGKLSVDLNVGCCTQVATFLRKSDELADFHMEPANNLEHIASIEFPYFQETGFSNADIVVDILEELSARLYFELATDPDLYRDDDEEMRSLLMEKWPRAGEYTTTVEAIWDVLRIRQLCKEKSHLYDVIRSEVGLETFRLHSDGSNLTILCPLAFPPSQERTQSISSSRNSDEYSQHSDAF
ncbi:Small RNA 2'-O-methyltransferase [Phlyctochytrium planicorne]|nr:Small RNA 2'-O-methyltransferase [Phlyctochytrium planicorne]